MNQVSFGRRITRSGAICLVAVSAALAAPALADPTGNPPEITSDQRGFVPTTGLAGEGNVQIETGVAGTEDGTGTSAIRSWSTPTVVRLGMPNNYEIRLQSAAYSHVRTQSNVTTGMSDLMAGLKAVLPQTAASSVSLAALVQATFPSGSSQLKNNGVRPEVQLVGEWRLPHATAISGMAGVRSDVDLTNTRYPTGMVGVNLSHTWSGRLDTYGEFAGRQLRALKYGGKNCLWDVGGSLRVLPSTRLNGSVGFGFKDNDTDMTWTVGISQRFRPPSPTAMTHRHTAKPPEEETPSATTEDGK